MSRKKIFFIVNPISGNQKHQITNDLVERHFDQNQYEINICNTKFKKHAVELTKKALESNPYCVVACGGDGTVNEVASCLVNTKVILGIIPVGSGNGLASNLLIPLNVMKSLGVLSKFKTTTIDVGAVNKQFFFSNMGFGIDANIIKNYESIQQRKFIGYLKAVKMSFNNFEYSNYTYTIQKQTRNAHPYLFFISNSNEMGYGLSLTPKALLNDGFFNLVLVEKINLFKQLMFGLFVLLKKASDFKQMESALIQQIEIKSHKGYFDLQIDGEYHLLQSDVLHIEVIHRGIEVIIP